MCGQKTAVLIQWLAPPWPLAQILDALVKGWGPELGFPFRFHGTKALYLTGKPSKLLDIALPKKSSEWTGGPVEPTPGETQG